MPAPVGKRGESGDEATTQFFYIFAVFVGALILLSFLNFILNVASGGPERVLAQDFGLTTMLVQSMPYDVEYAYEPGLEEYDLEIKKGSVEASSAEASYEFSIYNINDILVQEGFFEGVTRIPLLFDRTALTFGEVDREDLEQYCNSLTSGISEELTFTTDITAEGDTSQYIDDLQQRIQEESTTTVNEPITYVDDAAEANIITELRLRKTEESAEVTFKGQDIRNEQSHVKLVCFLRLHYGQDYTYSQRRIDTQDTPVQINVGINNTDDIQQITDNFLRSLRRVLDE